MIGGGVAVLLVLLVPKVGQTVGGIVTGDNELTRNATDSEGNRTTAYQGAGILGTAGAAANEASGGVFATVGGWIGRTAYDLLNPDPLAVSHHTR